jgi:V/A-type H+/Na+-transporting ATPase subunit E
MGLDKVINRVEHEGDETIKKLIADAEKQAEETLAKARQQANELISKRRAETDKHVKALRIQEENSLEIETKKIRLNAEKEALQAAFRYCLNALQEQPPEKILKDLLARAQRELPDATFVSSNNRDAPIVKALSKLTYSGTVDCLGGIIVENKDRSLKLDLRYETIATTVWDAHLKELADQLLR